MSAGPSPEDVAAAMRHPLWSPFVAFAQPRVPGWPHCDDWWPWWECFVAGALAREALLDDNLARLRESRHEDEL